MSSATRHAPHALASARHGTKLLSCPAMHAQACSMAHRNASSLTLIAAPRNARSIQLLAAPRGHAAAALPSLSSIRRKMSPTKQPSSIRRATTASGPGDVYEAVVVGAGVAGITAVGNLLENRIDRILWVDNAFSGGRVNKYYREVPSNTKVGLFMNFGTGVAPFRKIISNLPSRDRWEEPGASDAISSNEPDKLEFMRDMDQEKGCQLSHAADMLLVLTQGLKRYPGVTIEQGYASSANLDSSTSTWNIHISSSDMPPVQTKRLILATGAAPYDPPLPYEPEGLKHLDLDTALSPTKLSQLFSTREDPTTISIIGASHSAILVLWNLATLALRQPHLNIRLKWFTRHSLRYAEYEKDFVARDNTGLKGEAATWARENLEPATLPKSPISSVLEKISYKAGEEEQVYRNHLPGSQYVIQAIGYRPDSLPTITLNNNPIQPIFNHSTGHFAYTKSQGANDAIKDMQAPIPGLYGAGIAFPERVTDKKYGHEEMNVGFWKFLNAVKKWVPGWKAAASFP